jgi:hypothetical protein
MRTAIICGALALTVASALSLAGCVTNKVAWEHYDECAAETSSFRAMAECGKARRMAFCQNNGSCSDIGNSVVQYADALAQQVANREITEAQAKLKFVEFKTQQAQAARQQAATAAASGPTVCNKTGNTTICY